MPSKDYRLEGFSTMYCSSDPEIMADFEGAQGYAGMPTASGIDEAFDQEYGQSDGVFRQQDRRFSR